MDQAKIEEMGSFLGGYEMLNGSIGVLPIEEQNTEASNAFVKKYTERYDQPHATSESALNYQSLYVLVEAMKAAGTVDDTKAIMDAVNEGISNYPKDKMVLPLYKIGEKGNLKWKSEAGAVENGKVIRVPLE